MGKPFRGNRPGERRAAPSSPAPSGGSARSAHRGGHTERRAVPSSPGGHGGPRAARRRGRAPRAGDAGAFDRLYARHRGGVYRYLLRHVGNAATADELFQDVWMNAIRARATYAPTAKFSTWIYTLARHRLVDHWRSRGNVRVDSLDDDCDGETGALVDAIPGSRVDEPETRVASRATRERIDAAIAELPPAQRDAFLLHIESGMSLADIAALTGAGEETVKSRVRYAYAKLRATLGDLA
ncbi:MAG: sigma-70 family RNA polymerase sigma factor [Betaproteobacteria bacterium]|nr:sigma-70 family RNA polymerase sigma factor [Betaproteobacteria bacterium]